MTTTTKFAKQFDGLTILDGSRYIEATIRPGLTVRAYVEHDTDCDPHDDDCFDAEELAAWDRDEWQFATVTLRVYFDGRCIVPCLAGCGGVVHDEKGDGRALNDIADELLAENEAEAIACVRSFAKRAAKAAK